MNPSYDNAFGSFQQPAISSQGGDVVLSGGGKKSKKGLIIGIVVVLLLVVGGLAAYMLLGNNNNQKGGGGSVVTGDTKTSFNAYVNYVLNGTESNGNIDLDTIEDKAPHFLGLSSDEKGDYVKKAGEKYDSFSTAYYKSGGSLETVPMKAYYQDYASLAFLGEDDLLKEYLKNGKDGAKEYITNLCSFSGADNYLGIFLQDLREYEYFTLDMGANADHRGCIKDGAIVEGCYKSSEEESLKLYDLAFKVQKDESVLRGRASEALKMLYEEIYIVKYDTEAVSND